MVILTMYNLPMQFPCGILCEGERIDKWSIENFTENLVCVMCPRTNTDKIESGIRNIQSAMQSKIQRIFAVVSFNSSTLAHNLSNQQIIIYYVLGTDRIYRSSVER